MSSSELRRGLSRRQLLLGAAATATLAACASKSPTAAPGEGDASKPTDSVAPEAPTSTRPAGCTLSPEVTAGPYHLDGPAVRGDITEGRPGTPLELRVEVLAVGTCQPLADAAVDVWHCDAGGEYSGFNGNSLAATSAGGTNDKRFLRGVQLTDADGVAGFTTIFPGWYEGRAVHIHLEVHEGGTAGATYQGGHVAHTGQVFFDEPLTASVMAVDPYRGRTGTRTTNAEDSIFAKAGTGAIAELTPKDAADPSQGYTGTFTCLVDPAATPPPAPLF